MKRRKWTANEKLQIVLEGLSRTCSVAELCTRHQISQGQYYAWKDKLFNDGAKLFDHGGVDRQTERLEAENRRLKEIIGDLTVELKKNDW
jgi:transposase-like protein